jgi:electron transfer flavoprotein alpha subunit
MAAWSLPIYEGKLAEKVICSGRPVIATLRARAFPRPEQNAARTGNPSTVDAKAEAATAVVGYEVAEQALSVADASVVVSGGRGTQQSFLSRRRGWTTSRRRSGVPRRIQLIRELASVLGAAVAPVAV